MSSSPISPSEQSLYNELSKLPDFDCLPIPQSWFKKFGIPPRNPISTREYLESNYAIKMTFAPKDLPPLIINIPQQNGKLVEVPEVEEVQHTIVSRPFEIPEGEPFPVVLPSLTDESVASLPVPLQTCPETPQASSS